MNLRNWSRVRTDSGAGRIWRENQVRGADDVLRHQRHARGAVKRPDVVLLGDGR